MTVVRYKGIQAVYKFVHEYEYLYNTNRTVGGQPQIGLTASIDGKEYKDIDSQITDK